MRHKGKGHERASFIAGFVLLVGGVFAQPVVTDFGGEAGHVIFDLGDGRERVEGPYFSGVALSPTTIGNDTAQWRSLSITGDVTNWQPLNDHSDLAEGELTASGRNEVALPRLMPLSRVELSSHSFPARFKVEYTVGGGWLRLPRAELWNYPDPGDRRVVIDLHGIVANGVRVVSSSDVTIAAFACMRRPVIEVAADPAATAALTNLWIHLGTADTEVAVTDDTWWPNPVPLEGGMVGIASAEWSDFNSRKLSWSPRPELRQALEDALVAQYLGPDGYVWASPVDEKHLDFSRHYTTNASLAEGFARHFLWTRDREFLNRTNPHGQTVLDRGRAAIDLLLRTFGGESGLVTIADPEIDGTTTGKSNNYWDAWKFGGSDALHNVWTYEAVVLWAELETAIGETERASRLNDIAVKMRAAFAERFWNPETGRLVGAVDIRDQQRDYGFTFVNLAAMAAGLLDDGKATEVIAWLDGDRVVEGDTSMGDDIYFWRLAPRSNTLAAESDGGVWFEEWGGKYDVSPDGNFAWGRNVQNGGAILYVAADDVRARLRYAGPDAAARRLGVIVDEFAIDALRRQPITPRYAHNTILGILGPFPESGVVPLTILEGFLGVKPTANGLRILPKLPEKWPELRFNGLQFAGRVYDLRTTRSIEPSVEETGGNTLVSVPAGRSFVLSPSGSLIEVQP